ncbi:MAG: dehydrogenase [Planctomycetaceae bacterium]|nr:dehydrogenase [Planctomycetaceae bacterium]
MSTYPLLSRTLVPALIVATTLVPRLASAAELVQLNPGAHIAIIGNNLADRMQHHGWLETYLQAEFPQHRLSIRNLGFTGDEVKTRPRSANFGSTDQWLTKVKADVVFCFFGYNEALRGEPGLAGFRKDLGDMLSGMKGQKYNGKSAPQVIVFSPIAHEDLKSPNLPDGSHNNRHLAMYTKAMKEVCAASKTPFVDLFAPSQKLYRENATPLTLNGIHLLDHGNRMLADVIMQQVFGNAKSSLRESAEIGKLRTAVLDKSYYWFSRYRVVDGYNVFGGRSRLAWFGQSNADVMQREMQIFDVMTGNRDEKIWAVAAGRKHKVVDNNIPGLLVVKTNKPGSLAGGRHPYLGGRKAIERMRVAKGMEVNLFASEEKFPELINPVQMAVDTDGRLFASVWPSYPHWNPTKPRTDRILCLPDDDRDGVADRCVVFADKLNSVTGFEFWGGGMLVAAAPEIWFLKDTDGDDKADVKIRMLQGISSADTHHSANALVIGPDGWLYWSRGIFNIANMETPTRTYRSAQSGVHRFNPRTFEVEFHFPIGPNPHGDAFDRWGFQFANDGTGGTGSYVNIGKGRGNKKWFPKRVRPVAATGFLSSPHFPENTNGNFLICNTIGFQGVLQHEVSFNGADITAKEIEPILVSSDPNFRPTDIEIGGDGALYVSDWCNVLIGHMQHNMRDPNRDAAHGRIYRVSYPGRPLMPAVKMKGKPIAQVCENLFSTANSVRYRARLELSGRKTEDVVTQVGAFAKTLDVNKVSLKRDEAQALLECLWVFEEHRVADEALLKRVLEADEQKIRAAAIRTLGHWGEKVPGWQKLLVAGSRDKSPLVRAEAVKAAVSFERLAAAEAVFEAATRPTDAELNAVLNFARSELAVDKIVQEAVSTGKPLSRAAQAYVLRNASVPDLLKLKPTEAVHEAILSRPNVPAASLRKSLVALAAIRKTAPTGLLLDLLEERDGNKSTGLATIGSLLASQPKKDLATVAGRIEKLAVSAKNDAIRRLALVAWITADGNGDDALLATSTSKARLRDFLDAVPAIANTKLRSQLYEKVQPLTVDLPSALKAEQSGSALEQQGIKVDYFFPSAGNVAIETLAAMTPKASGVVPAIIKNVPQKKQNDKFALRFTGSIHIPKSGRYVFFANSDDGSRIYVGNKLVVNNDGLHGMVEKSGAINLPAGAHPLVVTYFDNGGSDGLRINWRGPGFGKRPIPTTSLSVGGGETLHDVAIGALASISGHDARKVADLAALIKAGRNRPAAIRALRGVPVKNWPATEIGPVVDNIVGYLSGMPASFRTGPAATDAMALARALSTRLKPDQAKALNLRLKNLNVRVIAIGTVPHRMIFDKERIAVQAGKPVEFRFTNTDNMPHNFAIGLPGSLEELGLLAEKTARDPDAMARHYIPKSDKVMLGSRLLQTGQTQALSFKAPTMPGVYPYVCTYPGHWRRMYGTLYVVANLAEYQANPGSYLAQAKLPIRDELLKFSTRGREWKLSELASAVQPLPEGRAFMVGKQLFKVANCVACHKLNNEGRVFGPDLAKLGSVDKKKHTPQYILESILNPSKDIDKKFQSQVFALDSGKVVTGMVVKETPDTVEIVIDPLAKGRPTVIKKSSIDDRAASKTSIMPLGLLNKLSREEILDLIAYVYARGDKSNPLFMHEHAEKK